VASARVIAVGLLPGVEFATLSHGLADCSFASPVTADAVCCVAVAQPAGALVTLRAPSTNGVPDPPVRREVVIVKAWRQERPERQQRVPGHDHHRDRDPSIAAGLAVALQAHLDRYSRHPDRDLCTMGGVRTAGARCTAVALGHRATRYAVIGRANGTVALVRIADAAVARQASVGSF
jgi:hypothetical protein